MTVEEQVGLPLYEITVSFRGQVHVLDQLPVSTTLAQIRHTIQELTSVPAAKQKLLPNKAKQIADLNHPPSSSDGAKPSVEDDDRTLEQVGIPASGLLIMVVGTPSKELEEQQEQEEYNRRKNGPRKYHPSMLRGNKLRNTTAPGSSFSPFGTIVPHPTTAPSSPLYDKIMTYLTRLANDPGILHICQLHQFRVGVLTELLPWESPHLLGLNENAGQKIYLRIRTDDAEGLRDYKTTRRVLVHELAHNKVADHPPEFKILNSELNAQIEAFEKRQKEGTHALVQGDVYEPQSAEEAGQAQALGGHRLGGSGGGGGSPSSVEERRRQILLATMKRLEKEEAEIELGCGSGNQAEATQ